MRRDDLLVAAAVAIAVLGPAPAALAQTYPPTTPPGTEVLGTDFERPAAPTPRGERGSTLPFTGSDLGAAGVAGAVGVVAGSALVLAARRRRSAG